MSEEQGVLGGVFNRDDVSPTEGGCWICFSLRSIGQPEHADGEGDWLISKEWDTNVHQSCLVKAIQRSKATGQPLRDEVRGMLERDFAHLKLGAV